MTSISLPCALLMNIFIDNELKLSVLSQWLRSMSGVVFDEAVINIRGSCRQEAADMLRQSSLSECLLISHATARGGWHVDTRSLLQKTASDSIFILLEDHFFNSSLKNLFSVVYDFQNSGAHYMPLSFNTEQLHSNFSHSSMFEFSEHTYLSGMGTNCHQNSNFKHKYMVVVPSLWSRLALKDHLRSSDTLYRNWPVNTPFDFERKFGFFKKRFLLAMVPKNELFACFDDDMGVPGYSLLSRGVIEANPSLMELSSNDRSQSVGQGFAGKLALFLSWRAKHIIFSLRI